MSRPEGLPASLAEVRHPLVGVIMGSDSDLKFAIPTYEVLDDFGIPWETGIKSAHRTPEDMHDYANGAAKRGLMAIIAFAGGSSHLQGMSASETILPVYGVAVEGSADPLSSSFGSQVRMPSEAPLAVMGKNEAAATNAGLHVVRTLAYVFPELVPKLYDRQERVADEVRKKHARLQELGPKAYLKSQQENS